MDGYDILRVIGKGAFGVVYLCTRKHDAQTLVLKTITRKCENTDDSEDMKNEVSILSKLDHPNVIKYYDSFMMGTNTAVIVMEHASRGSLSGFIKARNGAVLQQTVVMSIFAQLCMAVDYIHGKNIVHRDLTAHNVLLTGSDVFIVKLSDFGVSKYLHCRRLSSISADIGNALSLSSSSSAKIEAMISSANVIGTDEYIAPEICYGKPYTKSSDIWSLGCILYYMTTLQLPFIGTNLYGLVMQITNGSPDLNAVDRTIYDEGLIELIYNMLLKEPQNRFEIPAIISHPFVLPFIIDVGVNLRDV